MPTTATAAVLDRGTKHMCVHCNTLFYDLHKQPATCPKCHEKVAPGAKRPARQAVAAVKKRKW